jgi:hypothetical protein
MTRPGGLLRRIRRISRSEGNGSVVCCVCWHRPCVAPAVAFDSDCGFWTVIPTFINRCGPELEIRGRRSVMRVPWSCYTWIRIVSTLLIRGILPMGEMIER